MYDPPDAIEEHTAYWFERYFYYSMEWGGWVNDLERAAFKQSVFDVVAAIPEGYVLTYGAIAWLVGKPNHSRLVGKCMSQAPRDLTSHRVVNHMGRTVLGWTEQRGLLEAEGVLFKENGCVDLRKHLWKNS